MMIYLLFIEIRVLRSDCFVKAFKSKERAEAERLHLQSTVSTDVIRYSVREVKVCE